jgi:transposase
MGRYDLTDVQWERLKPLLPPEKPRTGRPNHDHRRIINGILWIDRTGAPWNDLPSHYGPVGTVSSRFYRWRKAGIWQRVLEALQALADRQGRIDWSLHFVDSTISTPQEPARPLVTPVGAQTRPWGGRAAVSRSTFGPKAWASRSPSV